MRRRFLIEVEGEFEPDTTPSDLAMEVDMFLDRWEVQNVRDFAGDEGCRVTEVTGESGSYPYTYPSGGLS